MSDVAIRLDRVGKVYDLTPGWPAGSLRELINSTASRALRRAIHGARVTFESAENDKGITSSDARKIWALRQVSMEIRKGETVGIIGPNGSGKSTLLKILAEITEPTEGEVYLNGRLTALIELGAGFHPELTGRENIYLSGAILGLTRKDIARQFFEILDFAELRDFVDTPLKHYSNGMAVRLGFALAVHVNPDILLIDEVLAVGDAAFRRRCFEKIDAFVRAKKTIVFVSHNLAEVQRIARRLILMDHGTVQGDDVPEAVIEKYATLQRRMSLPKGNLSSQVAESLRSLAPIQITDVRVTDAHDKTARLFFTHDEMRVQVRYTANVSVCDPVFRVQIYRTDGLFCHGMNTARHRLRLGKLHGDGCVSLAYSDLGLLQGDYTVHASVFLDEYDELPVHQWFNPISIRVDSRPVDGGGIFTMPTECKIETLPQNTDTTPKWQEIGITARADKS
jgi:lipopolysaccharide transport system ATP-binding protein